MKNILFETLEKIKAENIYIESNCIEFEYKKIIFSVFFHDLPEKINETTLTTFSIVNIVGFDFYNEQFYNSYEWEDDCNVIIDFIEELPIKECFEPYENLKNYVKDMMELNDKYKYNIPGEIQENMMEAIFTGKYEKK